MEIYRRKIAADLVVWQKKMRRRPSIAGTLAREAQTKINGLIPERVHEAITSAIRKMVKLVLSGSSIVAPSIPANLSLRKREQLVLKRIEFYRNAAAAEGGVTGMGGLLLGLADFPILLSMKIKLLFDIASIYGFNTQHFHERLYILHIFQLAFSSGHHRRTVFESMVRWDERLHTLPSHMDEFDWRTFQQEYRDHIDLAKMAQLLPVVGAIVGVVVNYRLIVKLGETAMNAYRMRLLKEKS